MAIWTGFIRLAIRINVRLCVILGFRHFVNEIWAFSWFYAAWDGSFWPTSRYNLSVPSSMAKHITLRYVESQYSAYLMFCCSGQRIKFTERFIMYSGITKNYYS